MSDGLPVAELREVSVRYQTPMGHVDGLSSVSLQIAPASATAIVGRSGSGKSTLVSVLSLLRRQTSGAVHIDGRSVARLSDREIADLRATRIGIVFQSFHLEPTLSALDNVLLPWVFAGTGTSRRTAEARALELLGDIGIGHLRDRRPGAMSGGQRQRIAVARALFPQPALLIADEPTGNLDEETANEVADLLFHLPGTFGTAVVVVTHDRAVAARADRRHELVQGRLSGGRE